MRNKKLSYILIAVGALLAALLGFCIVPVWNYITGRTTPWEEDYFSSGAASAATISISDEAVQGLLDGSVSLDEFYEQVNFSSSLDFLPNEASSAAAQAPADTPDAVSSSETASSISSVPASSEAPAQSSGEGSSSTDRPSSSAASTSSAPTVSAASSAFSSAGTEEPYEQEIKALIQQLYGVKARAESGLNQCIQAAYSEYHALPAQEQTQAKKVAICFSKAGQLSSLQASCDKEVNQIVSEMRRILRENGQSTALADSAEATYKNEKSAMYSTLMSRLYS